MRIHVAGFTALYLVAACSAPEPEVIAPEPTYDKFGNCIEIPGTASCEPDDDPCILPDGSIAPPGVICPPPGRGGDDSSTSGGGTPGTPGRP